MNLYDDVTTVTTLPALPAAGTPGYYTDGVVGVQARTTVRAWHLNAIQLEIVNTITGAGLTPSRANNSLLLAAIRAMIAAAGVGFTPVQQGGGVGQGTQKLNVGWDGTQLRLTVAGTDEGGIALKSDVTAAINALVNGAPGTLSLLNEIAAAINNDPTFAADITATLALKAPLASPALTGNPTVPTQTANDNSTKAASTAFVYQAVSSIAMAGNVSSPTGPWWSWNPVSGEVRVWGMYSAAITTEGQITVTFPVNIGTPQWASADIAYNTTTAATGAQVAALTATTMTVQIQDNQGGSAAAASGFYWEARGYSPTLP